MIGEQNRPSVPLPLVSAAVALPVASPLSLLLDDWAALLLLAAAAVLAISYGQKQRWRDVGE